MAHRAGRVRHPGHGRAAPEGTQAASDVTTGWRIALTILALGGLLAAIAGLWLALQATAGTPAKLNLTEVVAKYGGVRQFEVATALAASASSG